MATETTDPIQPRRLVDEMSSAYLDYAMSVIVSRALPDVRDGLKPVQRRILYAMSDLGMRANQPYRKSARIVGEVLGKYHPHSDQPVYDAMVRMAQDFTLLHPLVDGQGNYGSIDNDPPAAMRYTEARLSAISEELLTDLDKETVVFTPNFDESLEEPSVLPARVPNLLINGAAGIAVAMASRIPPHNLNEIGAALKLLLERPDASITDLMAHIQGPDFPSAGLLFAGDGRANLEEMYRSGRGGFTLQGVHHVEDTSSGNRQQIVFTELPYQANKVRIIEQIAAQVRDKKIDGIRDLRDESDRNGLRLVIELGRDGQYRNILNHLWKSTDLQLKFDGNFVALVDGKPQTLPLRRLLLEFIRHRRDIITKRSEFELKEAQDRFHIVEGLLKAIEDIDAVIATIRSAESAEAASVALQADPFDLSEAQARAVLNMQLRRLASLERIELEDEYGELKERIEYLEGLLADEKKIDGVINEDIDEITESYGTERKTQVIARDVGTLDEIDLIAHQASVVTLTRQGYIKRQPVDTFRSQRRGGVGVTGGKNGKAGSDEEVFMPARMISCDTHDTLLFFTDRGRAFALRAYEVETRSREWRGMPVRNLIELQLDEHVTTIIPISSFNDDFIILGTRRGQVKKTPLARFERVLRSGVLAFNLDADDELVEAACARADDDVIVASSHGQALRFAISQLRNASRTSGGVRAIRIPDDERMIGLQVIRDPLEVLTVTQAGFGKRTDASEYSTKGRAGLGMIGHKISAETGPLVGMQVVEGHEDLVVTSETGMIIRTTVGEVRQCGRATKGVKVMRVDDEAGVAAIAVVDTTREFGQRS